MIEFYPVHFYGFVNVNINTAAPTGTINLLTESREMWIFSGIKWKRVNAEKAYYYFEKVNNDGGNLYFVKEDGITNVLEIRDDNCWFEINDVIVDTIHGHFLQLLEDKLWYIRCSFKCLSVSMELDDMRKKMSEMVVEMEGMKRKLEESDILRNMGK